MQYSSDAEVKFQWVFKLSFFNQLTLNAVIASSTSYFQHFSIKIAEKNVQPACPAGVTPPPPPHLDCIMHFKPVFYKPRFEVNYVMY